MNTLRLSSRQRRQLEQQLKNSRDVRLYRRTLAALEYKRGKSVTEISRTLRVSCPSAYRWIERFRESSDPESLRDDERMGRPPAWTDECSQWLESLLHRSAGETWLLCGELAAGAVHMVLGRAIDSKDAK